MYPKLWIFYIFYYIYLFIPKLFKWMSSVECCCYTYHTQVSCNTENVVNLKSVCSFIFIFHKNQSTFCAICRSNRIKFQISVTTLSICSAMMLLLSITCRWDLLGIGWMWIGLTEWCMTVQCSFVMNAKTAMRFCTMPSSLAVILISMIDILYKTLPETQLHT